MQADEGGKMGMMGGVLGFILKESEKQRGSVDVQSLRRNSASLPFDREHHVNTSVTEDLGFADGKRKDRATQE